MHTLTVEYDNGESTVTVVLARPSVADGLLRRKIAAALDGSTHAHVFSFFVTQIVSTKGIDFQKLTVYPGDEEVQALFERFKTQDEAFSDLLNAKMSVLNGYIKDDSSEKKA